MSNELMLNEDIYLLYGSIPVERLCFMKGIISNRDEKEVFESDLRERFYRNNHAKYKQYFDEWVSNITENQLFYFEKERISIKNQEKIQH